LDVKGEIQGQQPKDESTDAKNYGGTACSSEEVSVMEMEQRSSIKQVLSIIQLE
jgi:hypothetical protein